MRNKEADEDDAVTRTMQTFHAASDGKAARQVLQEKPYASEDLLQQALASFPEVLAGSSTAEATVRPLLLVRREKGVPKVQDASPTWSVDHLFVDAEGVPVVVEVKRASDTRLRRGLGPDARLRRHAVRYWPLAGLRAAFGRHDCPAAAHTGDERLWRCRSEAQVDIPGVTANRRIRGVH